MALCRRGRFAEVYEPMRRAAAAHARAGAPDAASVSLANAACAAAFEHDWDRALALADRAGEYGRGVVRLEAHARAARAYVLQPARPPRRRRSPPRASSSPPPSAPAAPS